MRILIAGPSGSGKTTFAARLGRILDIPHTEMDSLQMCIRDRYGAPPMGGIAFGWDRVVSLLAGVDSIREVIAFPKTGNGYDPLTAAPAPITPEQRKEAGVDFKPKKKDEE